MKDELWGKVMAHFCALRVKTYSYLEYDAKGVKKGKVTKKCVIKKKTKFDDYRACLFNNNPVLSLNKCLNVKYTH